MICSRCTDHVFDVAHDPILQGLQPIGEGGIFRPRSVFLEELTGCASQQNLGKPPTEAVWIPWMIISATGWCQRRRRREWRLRVWQTE